MPPLCRTKHNRAKPMFETASALFSIADAGEFRFARFYTVCEEVPLGDTRKSAHCLRCVGHAPVGFSKRGRDTESDANIQQEEMHTFFSNEFPFVFPSEIPRCGLLILLLITQTIYAYCGNSFFCLQKRTRESGRLLGNIDKKRV